MNSNKFFSPKKMVRCAIVAAIYVALSLAFAPLSFGAIQVRFAELLVLLPVFGVEYIIAVTLGCLLTNFIGSSILDVIFGTAATLLACLITYALRKKRIVGFAIPAAIPPIIFNAVIIGAMITFFFMSDTAFSIQLLLFNMLTVGIGQVISCGLLGVGFVKIIETNKTLHKIFTDTQK